MLPTFRMLFLQSALILAAAANAMQLSEGNLTARAVVAGFRLTHGFCGVFSTADQDDSDEAIVTISTKDQACKAKKNTCSRLGYINTSGLYICAAEDEDFAAPCEEVATVLRYTVLPACSRGWFPSLSGQVFTKKGHNFIIAYTDSHSSGHRKPSSYAPPGPNGPPGIYCEAGIGPEGRMHCKQQSLAE